VLAVGRLVPKKAPILAIRAFLLAVKSGVDMRLTLIGTGPLESAVREYVSQHDHEGRVRLLGAQPHAKVIQAMGGADVFLQHSVTDAVTGDQEGAPVAILEAMASGLPVVATSHSGIPYLVEHGRTGLLSEEGNIAAMARSLDQIAKSPELRQTMAGAARERAKSFSWERERNALLKVLFPERKCDNLGPIRNDCR